MTLQKNFRSILDILESLVTWKDGADYTFWRVNGLANNLTNSRYFNYTLVDAIRLILIEKPLELPPDLQALVDQNKLSESSLQVQDKKKLLRIRKLPEKSLMKINLLGVNDLDQSSKLRSFARHSRC